MFIICFCFFNFLFDVIAIRCLNTHSKKKIVSVVVFVYAVGIMPCLRKGDMIL